MTSTTDEPPGYLHDLLNQVAHLSDAHARALASRWPLVEAPDGDVVLIAVPGRSTDPHERARIEAAHALGRQAVEQRAAALGLDPDHLPRHWACTLAEAQAVAVALTVRPDDVTDPDDTVATWYLAMTEVWRQVVGPPHDDDPPPLYDDHLAD